MFFLVISKKDSNAWQDIMMVFGTKQQLSKEPNPSLQYLSAFLAIEKSSDFDIVFFVYQAIG